MTDAHSSQANYRLHSADGNACSLAGEVVSSDYTLAEEITTEPATRCDRLAVTVVMHCDSSKQLPAGQVTGQQRDTVADNNEYQLAGATCDEYENFTSIQRYLLHIVWYPVHQPKYLRMANLIRFRNFQNRNLEIWIQHSPAKSVIYVKWNLEYYLREKLKLQYVSCESPY